MEKSLLDMREFFLKLLGVSTGVSSRRFIALLMLPSYIIGVFVGIFANNIDFYMIAMIAAAIPILIAYFSLSWELVKEITTGIFKKKEDKHERFDN